MMDKKILILIIGSLFFGCNREENLEKNVIKVLKDNPEIIISTIKNNPVKVMEAIQYAAKIAQTELAKNQQEEENKKLENSFENPLIPQIRSDESIRGIKGAPIQIVEYSDFECPYCSKSFDTISKLMEKYKNKISFIYKHLPLDFHKSAMISAQYYEAIRLQNSEMAFKFHDEIFKNQSKLKNGEAYLKVVAKKVGSDMKKLAKDIKTPEIQSRIDEDIKEAAKFGIQGTPGFLLNGIPIKGAYPLEYFENIILELQKRGKLKL